MKASIVGLCFLMASLQAASAQEKPANPVTASRTNEEQQIISLSKEKWLWMSERKVDSLDALFRDEAVFVHMGGTMSRNRNWMSSTAAGFNTSKRISRKCQCASLAPPQFC